MAHKQNFSN
ncbi:hypothetical protein F383_19840 [Gossypium arboreum]|uniref:Uncharacterized protein n=1 Tax=Gossypium arboreum TaxID=29729 RepID=A0A0B0NQV0_GOSAR|nr:hypothetical protein F383_19840 [Gossypium arboreum]